MARSLNKATIIGTLGRDPELRATPAGMSVCSFSIATDESYKDKNTGQKVEKTEWHRISAYGKLAEIMAQYLKKGSKVYIEGKLQTKEWEKDGIKRYNTDIVASEMLMLDSKNSNQSQQAPQQKSNYQAPQQQAQQGGYQSPQQQGYQAPQQPQQPQQQSYQAPLPHGQNANGTQASNMAPRQQQSNAFDDLDVDIPF